MSELIENYDIAIKEIKEAILKSQYHALKGANSIQLSLYFCIGKYISDNTRVGKWGTGALDAISNGLKKEMPGLRGFSPTYLKEMRIFYEAWKDFFSNSSLMSDEFEIDKSPLVSDDNNTDALTIAPDYAYLNDNGCSKFPINEFLTISFTHHKKILSKVKETEARLFYIELCSKEHLSVDALIKAIESNEFIHRGSMPNNFMESMNSSDLTKRAVLAFKDEYVLDFINVEELGVRDISEVNERVVENGIVQNIKNFIMEFGRDFAFLGNQYRVEAMGHEHFIDLLFFNRELACLVAIELKTGPFKPIYLGELNMYLQVLDDYVRKSNENPSIGIVLCKSADKSYAEYAVRDYSKPMGVAIYKTASDMPEHLRKVLPDLDDLKKLL